MTIFWRELLRGKGLWRAFLYDALPAAALPLRFPLIDIACGKNPGYRRILGISAEDGRMTTVDGDASADPSLVHDMASGPLPFGDGAFNTVFIINCIYAFPDPLAVLREARRILAPGGTAVMSFPLVFPYTPEPHDFSRFTAEGARAACAAAGFGDVSVRPLGGRWASAAYLALPLSPPYHFFALPIYASALALDRLADSFFPSLPPAPIGYLVTACRP